MRIHDLVNEQRLDEKPMGMLKSLGNKAMAAFGSGKAQGRVETGTMANQLRKQFDVYLGKTGEDPTPEVIVGFLKSKNLPTGAVEKMLGISSGDADQAAPGAANNTEQPAATDQPKQDTEQPKAADQTATTQTPTAEKPAAAPADNAQPAATGTNTTRPADSGAKAQPQAQDDKAAIAARVKANVGRSAAATKASGFGGEVEKPQPAAGAGAFGQMAQQLTKPAAEKPATGPAPKPAGTANFSQGGYGQTTTNAPTAAAPRVTGGVSSVTGKPAANPQQDLKAKLKAKQGAGQTQSGFKNYVQGAKAKGLNAGLEYNLDGQELLEYVKQMLGEKFVVDKGTLDKVFMAAAQDAAKAGFKPGEEIGFAGGFAAGKAQAGGFASNFEKAYKGSDAEAGTGSAAQAKNAGLVDETGLIPQDILKKINGLSYKERQQLLKELG
jgi:hypothetical protein